METSLYIRIYLIVFSVSSLVLQLAGLSGHNWYGFSLTMFANGRNVTGKMHGGLLVFSPLEICEGNEIVCKTPEQFSPIERRTSEELNRKFSQILHILRSLVITGITASTCGGVLLIMYLWTSKKPKTLTYTGTASAVSWMFTAVPEFIAVGVQIYVNMNVKQSAEALPGNFQHPEETKLKAKFTTPWDVTILGVGAILAFIVGLLVFITTFEKRTRDTAIRFSKQPGDIDEVKILQSHIDDSDEEI